MPLFPLAWLLEYQVQYNNCNNPHLMDLFCLKNGVNNTYNRKKYLEKEDKKFKPKKCPDF